MLLIVFFSCHVLSVRVFSRSPLCVECVAPSRCSCGLGGWWRGENRGSGVRQRSGCQFRIGSCLITGVGHPSCRFRAGPRGITARRRQAQEAALWLPIPHWIVSHHGSWAPQLPVSRRTAWDHGAASSGSGPCMFSFGITLNRAAFGCFHFASHSCRRVLALGDSL